MAGLMEEAAEATQVAKCMLRPEPRVNGKPVVALIHGETLYERVQDAFATLNLKQVIKPGDVVLVKPNLAGVREGVYAGRAIVEAVATLVEECTEAGEVVIGEGTASGGPTWKVFMALGLEALAIKYRPRLRLVDLNYDEDVWVRIRDRYALDGVWLPRTAFTVADVIVSVPVLKTWGDTAVSLGLKNMLGLPSTRHYSWSKVMPASRSKFGLHGEDVGGTPNPRDLIYGQSIRLAGVIVDICSVIKPNITLIDASLANDDDGNHELDLLIAGFDPVAVDSVGCSVMGFNPRKILHLQMAAEKGLGVNALDKVIVKGAAIENVRRACKPKKGMEEITVFNPSL